jgi:hypothetical protein
MHNYTAPKLLFSVKEEKITSISGRAKDDDGGGAPFHEMPYFKNMKEAMAWTRDARANPKQYRYIELSVDIMVTDMCYYDDGTNNLRGYQRWQQPFLHNANIESDATLYERLKGYGQFKQGEWVVIRNGFLVGCSENEADAWLMASRSTGRALVRQVGFEGPDDDRNVRDIVRRNEEMSRVSQ